jgi:hypothetical protein
VRDFSNIETRAVIKFFFALQGKAPKEIHAILTETLVYFLPDRAKDLSAPLYKHQIPLSIPTEVSHRPPVAESDLILLEHWRNDITGVAIVLVNTKRIHNLQE